MHRLLLYVIVVLITTSGSVDIDCNTSDESSDECTLHGRHTWSNGVCYYCTAPPLNYICGSISQSNDVCTCSNCNTPSPTTSPINTLPPSHSLSPTASPATPTLNPTNGPTSKGAFYCSTRDTTDIEDCQWKAEETAAIINGVCYYCEGDYCTLTQSDVNGYEQCICTNCQSDAPTKFTIQLGLILSLYVLIINV